MEEIMAQVDAQTALLPNWIHVWMNWMMAINLVSIFFVWKHKSARWVLAAFIVMMPLNFLIFHLTKNIHLLGIGHIVFWIPLLIYFFKTDFKDGLFANRTLYDIWLLLLSITFVISIVFDVRDIFLVATGTK